MTDLSLNSKIIFHTAFPIKSIEETKEFYINGLGCTAGRENSASIILNLGGHQLVGHLSKQEFILPKSIYPRHFGLIFTEEDDWDKLLERAKTNNLTFFETEKTRFAGKITEHKTFFLQDPAFNLLEFKFYAHPEAVFENIGLTEIGDTK